MSKDKSNRTGNVLLGRCWQVRANDEFYMNAFDAFGNRDHYDYMIYRRSDDALMVHLTSQPEEAAIKYWDDCHGINAGRQSDQKRKETGSD